MSMAILVRGADADAERGTKLSLAVAAREQGALQPE